MSHTGKGKGFYFQGPTKDVVTTVHGAIYHDQLFQ